MNLFTWLGLRPTNSALADEAVLVIDQHALPFRSPHWFGQANYHVRVFRPADAPKPLVIIGDVDNDPVASITNRFPEVAVIVANLVLHHPGPHPSRLAEHARWFTYYASSGAIDEQYTEVWRFTVVPGYEPPLVTMRYEYFRTADAKDLFGKLPRWQRKDYTVAKLQRDEGAFSHLSPPSDPVGPPHLRCWQWHRERAGIDRRGVDLDLLTGPGRGRRHEHRLRPVGHLPAGDRRAEPVLADGQPVQQRVERRAARHRHHVGAVDLLHPRLVVLC